MEKCDIKYNDVRCVGFERETRIFHFEYRGHCFQYKCKKAINLDLANVYLVIDLFLIDMNRDAKIKMLSILTYINESLSEIEKKMVNGNFVNEVQKSEYALLKNLYTKITCINMEV